MIVTNLGRNQHLFRRFLKRNPIAPFHFELTAVQGRVVSHDHPVARRIQFNDVKRFGGRKPKSLALADREKLDAIVLS